MYALHLATAIYATILTREPCFSQSDSPANYWNAVERHDRSGVHYFDVINRMADESHFERTLQWLEPGNRIRFIGTEGEAEHVARVNGPSKGRDCYVRLKMPHTVLRMDR